MSIRLKYLALLSCVVVAFSTCQRAPAEPASAPGPVDHNGDPLPPGAVARLGTLRFVHLGRLSSIAVSPDGKVVASGVTHGKEVYFGEKILHQKDGFTLGTGERVTLTAIRLWDAQKGTLIRELATPDAPVSCLQYSSDGRCLFAGCGRFLCAWDADTGKELWRKEGVPEGRFHYGIRAERLLVTKDKVISLHGGTLLCPVPVNGGASFFYHPQVVVRLWDRGTGKPLPTPEALQSTVTAENHVAALFHDASISADGRFAAVRTSRAEPLPRAERGGGDDSWKYTSRSLLIVDLSTGKVRYTLPGGEDEVKSSGRSVWEKVVRDTLAFSPDGSSLAVTERGEVRLVQTENGKSRLLAKGLPDDAPRLAFLGSKQLAAQLRDGTIRAWDVATGKGIDPEPAHTRAFLSARSDRFAAERLGNTVNLSDLESGKPVHVFEGHRRTPQVRFALHSRDLLLSSDGHKAILWETAGWKPRTLKWPEGLPPADYYFLLYPPDLGVAWEKGLYVREREGRLELWNFETGRIVRPLETAKDAGKPQWTTFCATGNRLMVQTEDSYHFVDVATGKTLSRLPRSHESFFYPYHAEMSARGTYFARKKEDKEDKIELYEVSSGKRLRSLTPEPNSGKASSILLFHFSPDEKTLTGEVHHQIAFEGGFSEEKVCLTLWDVPSGELFREIVVDPKTHSFWRESMSESRVSAVALSHDRRLVALTRTGGKEIEIWETASGSKRGVLTGHEGPVASLSFSADGKYLASGSEDTTVLVWDLHRPLQSGGAKGRLTTKEVEALWEVLTRPEAKDADLAMWRLGWAAEDTVPFLKKRLPPVAILEAGRFERLVADLDDEEFETRSAATSEIKALGDRVLAQLQKAGQQKNSLEKQERLDSLLAFAREAARPFGTTEKLRQWRTLEILERAATPEALELLKDLAAGAAGARITEEARAALGRLDSRAKPER